MDKKMTIKGRWWIDGLEKPALSGKLEPSSGLLILSVWTPQDATPEQAMLASVQMQSYEVPHVIFGADSGNNPVTLFGCVVIRYGTSAGLKSIGIHVGAVLKGLRISSWQEPFIRAVDIKPKFLHRWFNRRLHVAVQTDQNETAYRYQTPLHLEFPIESGVTLRFSDGSSITSTLDYEKVTADSQLWFVYDEPQSLASIMEKWEPWVSRLFGLFFGVPTTIEEISVYTTDPFMPEQGHGLHEWRGSVLQSTVGLSDDDETKEPNMINMVVPYDAVKDRLGEVVVAWNKVCNQLEPVIALFSAVTRRQSLYLEAQFMFLVQALEIYHGCTDKFESIETPHPERKRMLKAAEAALPPEIWEWAKEKLRYNARPLAKKLRDIFEAHKRESEQLFGDLTQGATKITNTRNHLTHHSDEGKGKKLIPDSDLGLVSGALEAILWVVLLREIGVDGEPVSRVVKRASRDRLTSIFTDKPQ